jgi:hypothetical protein
MACETATCGVRPFFAASCANACSAGPSAAPRDSSAPRAACCDLHQAPHGRQIRGAPLDDTQQGGPSALEEAIAHVIRVRRLQQHVERLPVSGLLLEQLDDRWSSVLRASEPIAVDCHRKPRRLDASLRLGTLMHELLENRGRLRP